MATEEIRTNNPFSTAAAGEEITQADQQLIRDFNILSPGSFEQKYGADIYDSLARDAASINPYAGLAAHSRTTGEALADTVKNTLTGAIGGAIDTGAFVTGLIGADDVSRSLAKASEGVQNIGDSFSSLAERAQKNYFASKQQALKNRLDREYQEDRANGVSESVANYRRLGKEFTGSIKNIFETPGQALNLGSSALGSIGTDVLMTGGLTAAGKFAAKKLPTIAADIAKTRKESRIADKIASASPWMASTGLQEGGNAYVQLLNEDPKIEDLIANSPRFNQKVAEYLKKDIELPKAQELAKADLLKEAAINAGLKTGMAALVANYFTSALAKPFTREAEQSYRKFVGESLTEPLEETLTEGAGQYASNEATQKYLDKNQDLLEDVGSSAAEGAVGGLGIVGARASAGLFSKPVKEAVSRGTQAIKDKVEAQKANDTSEQATYERVQELNSRKDALKEALPATDSANLYSVVDNLSNTADSIYKTTKNEEIGEEESSLDPAHAVELQKQLQGYKSIVNTTQINKQQEESEEAFNQKKSLVEDTSQKTLTAIDGMSRQISKNLSDKIIAQRNSYNQDTQLTEDQLILEGASLSNTFNTQGIEAAKKEFNSLPQNIQNQITSADYKNQFIKDDVSRITSETSSEANTLTVDSIKNKDFKALSPEEVSQLPESSPEDDITLQDAVIHPYKDGKTLTIETGGRLYNVDPELASALYSADENTAVQAIQNIVSEFVNTTNNSSRFSINAGDKSFTGVLSKDTLELLETNEVIPLNQEQQKIFADPNSTSQQKARALQEAFQSGQVTTRAVRELSPEVLEKQNKYLEDGEIKDFAESEIESKFQQSFENKTLTSKLKPVRRPIHIWNGDSPLKVISNLLNGDKEAIGNFLRMNNQTNAGSLIKQLFNKEDKYTVDTTSTVYKDTSLIAKLRTMLNPDGYVQKRLSEAIKFTKKDNMPKAFKDAFFDIDGKVDKKLEEISRIAAVHYLSILSSYPHELTRDELERKNIDEKIFEDPTIDLSKGVIDSSAIQHLATTLRKIMGVNAANTASQKDVNDFFLTWATEITSGMLKNRFLISKTVIVKDKNNKEKKLQLLTPILNYRNLFQNKSDIVLALLDPTLKNSWHTEPVPAKRTVSGTNIPNTAAQQKVIEEHNKKPVKLNTYLLSALAAIGGEEGFNALKNQMNPTSDYNARFFNVKDRISKVGQRISDRLAFDKMFEILYANQGKNLNRLSFYNSYVALKNGRIMQEGAATQQSNKLLRQLENSLTTNTKDLADPTKLKLWKTVIAQKLGASTAKELLDIKSVDTVLNFVKQAVNSAKYKSTFDALLTTNPENLLTVENTSQTDQVRTGLVNFINEFNQYAKDNNVKLSIGNFDEALNAALEMIRYERASEAERKEFDSRVALEIDGINDGPSTINMMYGMVMGYFTPQLIENAYRTGNFIGLDTTSQKALSSQNTLASMITGAEGKDLHARVSEEAIVRNFLMRAIEFVKESKLTDYESGRKEQGKQGIQQVKQFYNLMKDIGWIIEFDPNFDITKITELPKNPPFKFDREISKKLTTIIPYGSEVRGSTEQIVDFVMGKIAETISESVQKQYREGLTKAEEDKIERMMSAIRSFLEIDYRNTEGFVKSGQKIENLTTAFSTEIPKKEDLKGWTVKEGTQLLTNLNDPSKDNQDIRNFSLTDAGKEQLIRNFMVLFGEPAQYAVNEVLGNAGMRGSRVVTASGYVLNVLSQGLEILKNKYAQGSIDNLTGNVRYKASKDIEAVGPNFKLSSGAQVIVRKTRFNDADDIVYQDPDTGLTAHASTPSIDSAGVSTSPLLTQASGDASTVMFAYGDIVKTGLNVNQVFDGLYGDIDTIIQLGSILNKASNKAQRQRIFEMINKRYKAVGEKLVSLKITDIKDPFEAIQKCVINLAQGKLINGEEASGNEVLKSRDLTQDINSFVERIENLDQFEPSLYIVRENNKNNVSSNTQADTKGLKTKEDKKQIEANIEENIRKGLSKLFDRLQVMQINERIQKAVIDGLPKTIHHMSGIESNYVEGTPLTETEADELLKRINERYKFNPFKNFSSLISAYMNTLAENYYEDHKKELEHDFGSQLDKWRKLTNRDKGNEGFMMLTDEMSFNLMAERLPFKEAPKLRSQNNNFRSLPVYKNQLKKAFKLMQKRSKKGAVVLALYKRISQLLPENTDICIAGSYRALPADLQQVFKNSAFKGLFTVRDGKPTIYIISSDPRNLDITLDGNLETLFHEAIHATVSTLIQDYYKEGKSLTDNQKNAIKNLEELLDDFMDTNVWTGEIVPSSISRLRDILSEIKDPAERLDEALAYILSNEQIFEDMGKYTLKSEQANKRKASLLSTLVQAAKNALNSLLKIITGSALDSAVKGKTDLDNILGNKVSNFINYFGANTLVLISEERTKPRKTRKDQIERITGTVRAARADAFLTRFPTKDIQDYIKASASLASVSDALKKKGALASTSNVRSVVSQKAQEDANKLQEVRQKLFGYLKSYVTNPDDVVDLAVQFMRRDTFNPSTAKKLHLAYRNLEQNLEDPYFLVQNKNSTTQEELNRSQEIYRLIKGTSTIFDPEELTVPSVFNPQFIRDALVMSLAVTQPDINKVLGKINVHQNKAYKSIFEPIQAIEDIAYETIQKEINKDFKDKSLGEVVKVSYDKEQEIFTPESQNVETTYNSIFNAIDSKLLSGLGNIFNFITGKKDHFAVKAINSAPLYTYSVITEGLRKAANRTFKKTVIADVIKEIYGKTPTMQPVQNMLTSIKGWYDRIRSDYLEELPRYLKGMFKNTDVTFKTRKFLYRTLGKTNIVAFTTAEAKSILTSQKELKNKIIQTEADLQELSPVYANDYKRKAKELALYVMGKENAAQNLLTNPMAISKLLGENKGFIDPSADTITAIDKLISLYCLDTLTEGDFKELNDLYFKDEQAMTNLIEHLRTYQAEEKKKVEQLGDQTFLFNYMTDSLPKGNIPTGDYQIIPKAQWKKFKSKGYKIIGEYQKSSADSSGPMLRVYCQYPQEQTYMEGIFQSINQTSFGWVVNSQTRNEAPGTKIYNNKTVKNIYDNLHKNATGLNPIPIYDMDGFVVGYERSIPKDDREFLDKDADLFTGMAQILVRRERELQADHINLQAIDMAWDEYNRASADEKAHEFIDVMHLNDPMIKKSLARLNHKTLAAIKKKFGNHLYLRADVVDSYLGHNRMSITDMWDRNFVLPAGAEKFLVKCIEAVFGDKARWWLGAGEQGIISFATFIRDTIVIRSGIVAAANAMANTLILHFALGMPFKDILKSYRETWNETYIYNKLSKQKRELEFKLASTTDAAYQTYYKEKIRKINEDIQNLSIYRLLKEGEYSTISAEGLILDDVSLLKNNINDFLNSKLEKIPGGVRGKSITANALMLKGTTSYQVMAEFINMGDWMAKVAGYRYLTEHSTKYRKRVMDHESARNLMSLFFVDYNQPVSREREYLNRLGLTWFMTYKWRMIPAAMYMAMTNPSRVLLGTLFESYLPIQTGTPFTENLLTKIVSGDIGFSVGFDTLLRGLTFHPIAMLLGLSK